MQPRSSLLAVTGKQRDYAVVAILTLAQIVACAATVRRIRDETFEELRRFRRGADDTDLERSSRRLGDLELDLSFGVEAYLPTRLVGPTQPLQELGAQLSELLQLSPTSQVVGTMLQRLGVAIGAAHDRAEADRARGGERLRTAWSLVAAVALALGVVFGVLGANVAETDPGEDGRHASLLDTAVNAGVPWMLLGLVTLYVVGWAVAWWRTNG